MVDRASNDGRGSCNPSSSKGRWLRHLLFWTALGGVSGCSDAFARIATSSTSVALYGGQAAAGCGELVAVPEFDWCTGVLLHERLVVFPAHCGMDLERIAIAGSKIAIERCEIVPNEKLIGRDVAYCLLQADADTSSIFVPATGCELQYLEAGTELLLRAVGLPDAKERSAIVTVEEAGETIVVSAEGVGACAGDSGGPAVMELSHGNITTRRLVGFISFGAPGCQEGAIHLNPIAPFVPWLERRTGIDISPCGTAAGEWEPNPLCQAATTSAADCESDTAWDLCGEPFSASAQDSAPPDIALAETLGRNLSSGVYELQPTVLASDSDSGVRRVLLIVTDDSGTEVVNSVRSLHPYEFGKALLPPGSYEIKATAWDFADNQSQSNRRLVVEPAPDASGCTISQGRTPIGILGSYGVCLAFFIRRRACIRIRTSGLLVKSPTV